MSGRAGLGGRGHARGQGVRGHRVTGSGGRQGGRGAEVRQGSGGQGPRQGGRGAGARQGIGVA